MVKLKIYKKQIYALIIFSTLALLYIIRTTIGYYTPDEILFFSGKLFNEEQYSNAALKYKVISKYFEYIYNQGAYFLLLINSILVSIVYSSFYKFQLKYHILKKNYQVVFFFVMPTVLFYSVSYLRDIYLYLLVIMLMIYMYEEKKLKVVIIIFIMYFLRPELSIIFLVAIILNTVKINFFIVFTFMTLGIIVFLKIDYLYDFYYNYSFLFEKRSLGLGLLQLSPIRENAIFAVLSNLVLFHMPYWVIFIQETYSMFDLFFLLDSIIMSVIFLNLIYGFSIQRYKKDSFYRFLILVLLLSSIYAFIQSTPSTASRHKLFFIPFLITASLYNKKK